MTYYIAKDCGAGWDLAVAEDSLNGWGVSRSQEKLARKLGSGDVLLHYIDHAQAWAGYSEVTGVLIENTRDKDHDWRMALPWVLPMKRLIYLSKRQCQLTRSLSGVQDRHRQRTFTMVPGEEARAIREAIEGAAMSSGESEDLVFSSAWEQGADSYYGDIRKALAGYKCEACGADGITWANEQLGGRLREGDEAANPDWFLEAAHIIPRHKKGLATPDNLRALCRNCHHSIDRWTHGKKVAYLRNLGNRCPTG